MNEASTPIGVAETSQVEASIGVNNERRRTEGGRMGATIQVDIS